MDTSEEHYRALTRTTKPDILTRGAAYVRSGAVMGLSVNKDNDGTLTLEAVVRGTHLYDVRVVHVASAPRCNISCTCSCNFPCKHGAAVMLSYLKSVRNDRTSEKPSSRTSFFDDVASHDHFDPATFMVVLHADGGFAPSLHPRNRDYTYLDPKHVRHQYTLSSEGAELLDIIEQAGYASSYSFDAQTVPLERLFTLIDELRLPVMIDNRVDEPRQITLHTDPTPLPVTVEPRLVDRVFEDEFAHLEAMLVLPEEREPGPHRPETTFHASGEYVLRETPTKLALYNAGVILAPLIARAEPYYEVTDEGERVYECTGTVLYSDELLALENLTPKALPTLDLTLDPQLSTLNVVREKPQPVLVIEYDATTPHIKATPYADYGAWRSDLSANISTTQGARASYRRKQTAKHDGTHLLAQHNNSLHLVSLDDPAEIALYKQFEQHHVALGLTKRLHCSRRGNKAVSEYLAEWPTMRTAAAELGVRVEFNDAPLAEASESLSARFTTDIDEERDWLSFDVELYCGEERISIETLYALAEGTQSFIHTEDGRVIDIANKPEIERLARLLKSFRAGQGTTFRGTLARTPEVAYVATHSPHYSATHSKSVKAFLKRATLGKPVKAVRLTKRLTELLRPYQIIGLEWLYFLRSHHFGGILADDMGLGKTLQTLTLLARECKPGTPSLVLCPKSLVHNWVQEAHTFFPKLSIVGYDGSPNERTTLRATLCDHDVVVMSYHTFLQDHEALTAKNTQYHYAILDEAQYIKNHQTKLAQRVKELPAQYRLALSGTPLENHVFEVWSIFDFLMPGFLGAHEEFKARYQKPIMEHGDTAALEELRARIAPFMLRRIKEEVLTELPPKVEQTRECALSDSQATLYQEVLREVRGTVFGAVEEKGYKGAQIHILAGLTKLRQVCNHPALLTKDKDFQKYDSTKLDACLELVDEVRQSERKVLIFSQFTGMLDILSTALTEHGVGHASLTGRTKKRAEVIETFSNDPAVTAFLISLKAGGTGLNLTAADTVIIFDPWWNPSVERQAIDRTHRMGQTQSVNVYRLLTTDTIEEKIERLKEKKRGLFDAVVSDTGELTKKLTWDDVRALFEG